MTKIIDIYQLPGKNIASIVFEGKIPGYLKIGSQIKHGDNYITITGIPFVRPFTDDIDTGTFGVLANSEKLKVGDVVEII